MGRSVQVMVGLVGRSEQYSSWWGWWVGQSSTVHGGAGG